MNLDDKFKIINSKLKINSNSQNLNSKNFTAIESIVSSETFATPADKLILKKLQAIINQPMPT